MVAYVATLRNPNGLTRVYSPQLGDPLKVIFTPVWPLLNHAGRVDYHDR